MLNAVNFVSGAIGKSDIDMFRMYHIKNGRITATNSEITMSAPIPLDMDCSVDAKGFLESLKRCKETISITRTPAGRIRVLSGKFRSFVDTSTDVFEAPEPDGDIYEINGERFVNEAKRCLPAISKDETRYYLTGVYFADGKLVSTNGIVLIECDQGDILPQEANIPYQVINILCREKSYPINIQLSDKSVTFHYDDGRWISSRLIDGKFPDYKRVLGEPFDAPDLHPEFWDGVNAIINMSDKHNSVFILENCLRTEALGEDGAQYDIEGLIPKELSDAHLDHGNRICYNAKHLKSISHVMTKVDFSHFPATHFFGENCRGAIMGIRG